MSLVQSLISSNKYGVKCPYSMKAQGICIHNTANDASARNEISYMHSNNNEVSYHIAVDDVEAIQGLPLDRNAWHAGDGGSGSGNRNYIAVEICYSKSGGSRFEAAERRAAKEVAALLKKYGWGVDKVRDHRSFSGKNCPHRTNMVTFKNLIQSELNKLNEPTTGGEMYRVRTSWGDASSQKGAFSDINNAKKCADQNPGHYVFNSSGIVIYPTGSQPVIGTIGVNSKVKVIGSKYATGQAVPEWVKQNTYTVQEVSGNKALLKEITSWVYITDLTLVSGGTVSQPAVLKVGSKVKVTGSTYATGQAIPNWVKSNTYTVSEISGSKALIKEIMSWVYTKDLKIV